MNTNYLLITLGHNSSAMLVYDDGKKVIGYEQERLSGIKADSQFPMDAILEIIKHTPLEQLQGCTICISNWFNIKDHTTQLFTPCKYIELHEYNFLCSLSSKIIFTDSTFSHHDAHAYSAYSFFDYSLPHEKTYENDMHVIVADGFGNNEEVLSIYKVNKAENKLTLIHRCSSLYGSLGLLYQYATSYCGMKENQDEYKFLGYESHVDEFLSESSLEILNKKVVLYSEKMFMCITHGVAQPNRSAYPIDFYKLIDIKGYFYRFFYDVEATINNSINGRVDGFQERCIIAYFIQQVIESVMCMLLKRFKIHNVIVAGGCFYNVKLNNKILKQIPGLFCAMPLAGDQGAAIGMYRYITSRNFAFSDLCYGKRKLYNIDKLIQNIPNTHYINDFQEDPRLAVHAIAKLIADGNIVNVVIGNMEFGPRALCHTSTLFLPTAENAACNNHMNNRNEVMPCAPVCTQRNANILFNIHELDRVIGSDEFMICTHEYNNIEKTSYKGVMHKKPLEQAYTGRPQIAKEKFMIDLLDEVERLTGSKCLVNTSFNAHGRPIAFETMDIIHNFNYQYEHAEKGKKPYLFILKQEKE